MAEPIDLRSDTVTQPSEGMRKAMAAAAVGDDVYGEDPSCRELEERVADLLGTQAALFVPSGSLANILGVGLLVGGGQELLCEATAHIVRAELGAHAQLAGVTTRTWSHPRGWVDLDAIRRLLAPDAGPHLVSTAAVAVEHTHNFGGGTLQPLDALSGLRELTREAGVGIHLDGARLWNAAAATGVPPSEYAAVADTVAVCLSKGLGAPIGSLVAGSAERIATARVWRKRFGAGWRQAGILAAAGLYALDHHRERLNDDHAHARLIAETLAEAAPDAVRRDQVETNMVLVDTSAVGMAAGAAASALAEHGVLAGTVGPGTLRLATHLGVDRDDCQTAAAVLSRLLAGPA